MNKFTNTSDKPLNVLAVNDLSGHSHTSLMAIIPIMNAMGISVTALPTAILSSNTEQDGYKLVEMTHYLPGFLEQWSRLRLSFSAIYSGFLSSEQQVQIVLDAIDLFKQSDPLIVVDPVMADNGELYPCFDKSIVKAMQKLITRADIITPNLTEAAFLLDENYDDKVSLKTVKIWCKRLSAKGPDQVVITNVILEGKTKRSSVICYDKKTDAFHKASCSFLPVCYPGAGDIFTSVLISLLLKSEELFKAADKTVRFVSKAMQISMATDAPAQEGICLEKAIKFLPKA